MAPRSPWSAASLAVTRSPGDSDPAGGRMLPPSAAAPQTDCPRRCPTRNCPCAITPPVAGPVPPQCWLAPLPRLGQRSTAASTTCPRRGTAPPPCRPGSPARARAAAPAVPGAVSSVAATLGGRARPRGTGATTQTAARFPPVPSSRRASPLRPGLPGLGVPFQVGIAERPPLGREPLVGRPAVPTRRPPQSRTPAALLRRPYYDCCSTGSSRRNGPR